MSLFSHRYDTFLYECREVVWSQSQLSGTVKVHNLPNYKLLMPIINTSQIQGKTMTAKQKRLRGLSDM